MYQVIHYLLFLYTHQLLIPSIYMTPAIPLSSLIIISYPVEKLLVLIKSL